MQSRQHPRVNFSELANSFGAFKCRLVDKRINIQYQATSIPSSRLVFQRLGKIIVCSDLATTELVETF